MTELQVQVHQLEHSSQLSDGPWQAVVADCGEAHAEAGVELLSEADAFGPETFAVYGWNAETRQSYLNSTHPTELEALAVARALVTSKVAKAALPGPLGLGEAELEEEAEAAHRAGAHDSPDAFDPHGCGGCQRELLTLHGLSRHRSPDDRCFACHLEGEELERSTLEDVHRDGAHAEPLDGCPSCARFASFCGWCGLPKQADQLCRCETEDEPEVLRLDSSGPRVTVDLEPIAEATYTTQACSICDRTVRDGRHLVDDSPLCPSEATWERGVDGARSAAIVAANESQLHRPLEEREPNPHTGGIPLTAEEAFSLAKLDQVDCELGVLMSWMSISDCDDPGDPDTGECVCWAGVNELDPSCDDDEQLDSLETEAPFEWWS